MNISNTIRSFTTYACKVDDDTVEKEISFHVMLGPHTERKQDTFPVYRIPEGKMVWLSDWSFNAGNVKCLELSVGQPRCICGEGRYIRPQLCRGSRRNGDFLAGAIDPLPGRRMVGSMLSPHGGSHGSWCSRDFPVPEVTGPDKPFETETFNWPARTESERFPPAHMP